MVWEDLVVAEAEEHGDEAALGGGHDGDVVVEDQVEPQWLGWLDEDLTAGPFLISLHSLRAQ